MFGPIFSDFFRLAISHVVRWVNVENVTGLVEIVQIIWNNQEEEEEGEAKKSRLTKLNLESVAQCTKQPPDILSFLAVCLSRSF